MNEYLRKYVQKITKLPTLPVIAQEILSLEHDDLITVDKLEKIIENDPAITAKVLSVSNSAYFNMKSASRGLDNAIMRIGFNNVKNIAIGVSLMTVMADEGNGGVLDYQKIFNHSVTVAFIAKMLTREIKSDVSEDILMDGILHDIGFLILSNYFSSEYKQVMQEYQTGKSILEAEESVFGFTHAEIGSWLAEQWKLPPHIQDVVFYHHNPSQATNRTRVAVVHIADYIASETAMAPTKENPRYTLDPSSLEVLSISEADFKVIAEKMTMHISSDNL